MAVISLNDFGPSAVIETFDSLTPRSHFADPLVLEGVSYAFDGGGGESVAEYQPGEYLCISGNCILAGASSADLIITLPLPVERVGGYLGGSIERPTAAFYDSDGQIIGSTSLFVPATNVSNSPAFFGFQADTNSIKFIRINPHAGVSTASLDNFIYEVVSPPIAAIPEPAIWAMILIGFLFLGLLGRLRRLAS